MRFARTIVIACAVALLAFGGVSHIARAAENAGLELPAGHPDISKMRPTSRPASGMELPSGHPDISKMLAPTTRPAGGMALPAGHPDIPGMKRPTTGPAATVGTLTVHIRQGTKNGPSLAGRVASADFYHRGELIRSLNAKIDSRGDAIFSDVPLLLPVLPLVKLVEGGVQYQRVGDLMDGYDSTQTIEFAVYEPTEQAPDWSLKARQVMVQLSDSGLQVSERVAFFSPADKTWLGEALPEGRRISVWLDIPEGAKDLTVADGMDAAFLKTDGKLRSMLPLTPGTSRLTLSYAIPATEGRATLTLTAPKAMEQMTIFVSEGGRVSVEGLQAAASHNMGAVKARIYKAGPVEAGHVAKLMIQLPAPARTK